jgi:hypothetical protein
MAIYVIYQQLPLQNPPKFTQNLVFLAWKYSTIWQPCFRKKKTGSNVGRQLCSGPPSFKSSLGFRPGWPHWANFRLLTFCLLGGFSTFGLLFIGPNFDLWAIVNLSSFFNYRSSQKFLDTFSRDKMYNTFVWTKHWLAYVLGEFFTNSPGHPVSDWRRPPLKFSPPRKNRDYHRN